MLSGVRYGIFGTTCCLALKLRMKWWQTKVTSAN